MQRPGQLETKAIFGVIKEIRKRADLAPDTVIVLLSRVRHAGNWFSIGEGNSHYMHADDWNLFMATSFRLPVTFLLASNIIMRGMYDTLEELTYRAHSDARGCIMDLCGHKQEISLKLRTADACPECMARIRSRIRSRADLDANVAVDCFRVMDRVRRDLMFQAPVAAGPRAGPVDGVGLRPAGGPCRGAGSACRRYSGRCTSSFPEAPRGRAVWWTCRDEHHHAAGIGRSCTRWWPTRARSQEQATTVIRGVAEDVDGQAAAAPVQACGAPFAAGPRDSGRRGLYSREWRPRPSPTASACSASSCMWTDREGQPGRLRCQCPDQHLIGGGSDSHPS